MAILRKHRFKFDTKHLLCALGHGIYYKIITVNFKRYIFRTITQD